MLVASKDILEGDWERKVSALEGGGVADRGECDFNRYLISIEGIYADVGVERGSG